MLSSGFVAPEGKCLANNSQLQSGMQKLRNAPFRMHSRLKSAKEHCSFLIAEDLVMYAFAAPAFPFVLRRAMTIPVGRR